MRILIPFVMLVSSPAFAATCADDLMIAVAKPFVLPDDRLVVEISYGADVRRIELPTWVKDLAGTPGLKALVLAGNSGVSDEGLDYFKTRHSLAHVFGEAFLDRHFVQSQANEGGRGGGERRFTETVSVKYDDGTARDWTGRFRTTFPLFRTETGEIFFLPDENAVVIKAIGDYNEIGDFATIVTDLLGVAPVSTLLVRDDLELPQGELELRAARPAEYHGNNAVLSMIRTRGYQTLRDVKTILGPYVGEEAWDALDRAVRRQLDGRGPGLVENVEDLLQPYRKFVEKDVFRARAQRIPERVQMNEARRPMGALIAEAKVADPARKAELSLEIERIKRDTASLAAAIPAREEQIQEDGKRLIAEIRAQIAARLSFPELLIGTGDGTVPPGPGNGSLKADFVLKKYPQHVFGESLWREADAKVLAWLKAPPVKRGGARIR